MYTALTIFAALVGLAVCGAAAFTAWYHLIHKKSAQSEGVSHADSLALRWTVLDWSVVAVVAIGLLFLLADVIGVLHERDSYPYYHYGYLLIGFVFSCLGLLLLVSRIFLLLRVVGTPSLSLPHDENKPNQADQAEQGIQHGQ